MRKDPIPGTYGAITRSTEEEHRAFMHALRGLSFTREEFVTDGPGIVMKKAVAVLDELSRIQPKSNA